MSKHVAVIKDCPILYVVLFLFSLVEQNKVETSVVTSLTNQSTFKQPCSQGEQGVIRSPNDTKGTKIGRVSVVIFGPNTV